MRNFLAIVSLILCVQIASADQYDEAVDLIKAGKVETAQIVLESMIKADADDVRALYALGYAHEKQNREDLAVDLYRRALAANLTTGRHSGEAKRAMKRLFELQPRLKSVLEKAWELETEASQAEGDDQRFLRQAAQLLYSHALNADIQSATVPVASVDNDRIAETLGYELRLHKIGAKKFDGNGHYYMVFKEQLTWQDAYERCKEMGGYLATITSKEESDFVASLINDSVWIGGVQRENSWTWITGEVFDFQIWRSGYPKRGNGDRLTMVPMGFINYRAAGSPNLTQFLCEWND